MHSVLRKEVGVLIEGLHCIIGGFKFGGMVWYGIAIRTCTWNIIWRILIWQLIAGMATVTQ